MAKKSTASKKKLTKSKTPKVSSQESHLISLIEATEKVILKDGSNIDDYFINQTARLKKELDALRKG